MYVLKRSRDFLNRYCFNSNSNDAQRIRKTGKCIFKNMCFARLYISLNKYQIIDYKKESYLVSFQPTFLSTLQRLFVERKN